MTAVFRWYVSRIYPADPTKKNGESGIKIKITPESKQKKSKGAKKKKKKSSRIPRGKRSFEKIEYEELEWWDRDFTNKIFGWVSEDQILDAVINKNMYPEKIDKSLLGKHRKIEENMVFLQFVDKIQIWNDVKIKFDNNPKKHDLSPFLEIKDAYWVDFTMQAREGAKKLYNKALGKKEVIYSASQQ